MVAPRFKLWRCAQMRRAICSAVGSEGSACGDGGGGGGGKSGLVDCSPRRMLRVREFLDRTVPDASTPTGARTLRGTGAGGVKGCTSSGSGMNVRAAISGAASWTPLSVPMVCGTGSEVLAASGRQRNTQRNAVAMCFFMESCFLVAGGKTATPHDRTRDHTRRARPVRALPTGAAMVALVAKVYVYACGIKQLIS